MSKTVYKFSYHKSILLYIIIILIKIMQCVFQLILHKIEFDIPINSSKIFVSLDVKESIFERYCQGIIRFGIAKFYCQKIQIDCIIPSNQIIKFRIFTINQAQEFIFGILSFQLTEFLEFINKTKFQSRKTSSFTISYQIKLRSKMKRDTEIFDKSFLTQNNSDETQILQSNKSSGKYTNFDSKKHIEKQSVMKFQKTRLKKILTNQIWQNDKLSQNTLEKSIEEIKDISLKKLSALQLYTQKQLLHSSNSKSYRSPRNRQIIRKKQLRFKQLQNQYKKKKNNCSFQSRKPNLQIQHIINLTVQVENRILKKENKGILKKKQYKALIKQPPINQKVQTRHINFQQPQTTNNQIYKIEILFLKEKIKQRSKQLTKMEFTVIMLVGIISFLVGILIKIW